MTSSWLRLACQKVIVRRDITLSRFLRIGLTALVPYLIVTLASVSAARDDVGWCR